MPVGDREADIDGGQPILDARSGTRAQVGSGRDEQHEVDHRHTGQQEQAEAGSAHRIPRHQPRDDHHPEGDLAGDDHRKHHGAPRLIDHDERRGLIAAAVWRLVLERGLAGVSVRSVAAEAGLATASLRRAFPTQDALLVFCFDLVVKRAPLVDGLAMHLVARPEGEIDEVARAILASHLDGLDPPGRWPPTGGPRLADPPRRRPVRTLGRLGGVEGRMRVNWTYAAASLTVVGCPPPPTRPP